MIGGKEKWKEDLEAIEAADAEDLVEITEAEAGAVLAETDAEDLEIVAEGVSEETTLTAVQEKCTKQSVLNARKNAKFLSNQLKENLFIAENAL